MIQKVSLTILGIFFVTSLALPVWAQDTSSQARIESILTNYETIPTRETLLKVSPDAQDELVKAAADADRSTWTRQRALTLLSLFPNPQTIDALKGLTRDTDPEIRRLAYYTLARTFGKVADDALVNVIATGLKDNATKVREFTVRGLRYVTNENAERILNEVAANDDTLAAIARDALTRRAAN